MKKIDRLKYMSLWPPLLGAGIRVGKFSKDNTSVDVTMKLRWWNRNYHGTHYGGSLFSMTDPFYALILIKNLGNDYVVWDKAAEIKFIKPGKGKLTAHFNIARERIADIRKEADDTPRSLPQFTVDIKDETGGLVARVKKTVYVCRKDKMRPSP